MTPATTLDMLIDFTTPKVSNRIGELLTLSPLACLPRVVTIHACPLIVMPDDCKKYHRMNFVEI